MHLLPLCILHTSQQEILLHATRLQVAAAVCGSTPTQFGISTDVSMRHLNDVTCPLAAILELLAVNADNSRLHF